MGGFTVYTVNTLNSSQTIIDLFNGIYVYTQEQLCDLNSLPEGTSTSKTSDSTEIVTSFSEPSLITSLT